MLRRLLLAVVPLLVLSGCGSEGAPAGPWSVPATTDQQRWELLALVRELDPCRLLPDERVAALGTVVQSGRASIGSCEWELDSTGADSAEPRADTRLLLMVDAGSPGPPEGDSGLRQQDGVTLLERSDLDALRGIPLDRVVRVNCTVHAWFPSSAKLMLLVGTPVGVDPCAGSGELIGSAVAAMRAAPLSAPPARAVASVLDTADPCAVLGLLGVTAAAEGQRPYRCEFTYRGGRIEVEFADRWLHLGTPRFVAHGRPVHGERDPVAGAEGNVVPITPIDELGTPVPKYAAVVVHGGDVDAVDEVTRRVLETLPAP